MGSVDKLDSISAQIVLGEIYDTEYNICNHDEPGRSPLSLVGYHTKENYADYGPLHHMVYRYRFFEVYKHFGLSLVEFLQLPREYTELIFEVISHENKKSSSEVDSVMKDIRGGRK
jgi:hypothetical protein